MLPRHQSPQTRGQGFRRVENESELEGWSDLGAIWMEEPGKTSLLVEHLSKLTGLCKERSRNPKSGTKPEMLTHMYFESTGRLQ